MTRYWSAHKRNVTILLSCVCGAIRQLNILSLFSQQKSKAEFLIVYHLVDKSTHAFIVFIKAFVSVRDAKTQCLQTNETEGTFSHW